MLHVVVKCKSEMERKMRGTDQKWIVLRNRLSFYRQNSKCIQIKNSCESEQHFVSILFIQIHTRTRDNPA